jgi:hypothetical protein
MVSNVDYSGAGGLGKKSENQAVFDEVEGVSFEHLATARDLCRAVGNRDLVLVPVRHKEGGDIEILIGTVLSTPGGEDRILLLARLLDSGESNQYAAVGKSLRLL